MENNYSLITKNSMNFTMAKNIHKAILLIVLILKFIYDPYFRSRTISSFVSDYM